MVCNGDRQQQQNDTIVSSQLNDRASDMSGKSNRTDGSSVLQQQILRSFKQKEYGNLKPVLVEAAERNKSP